MDGLVFVILRSAEISGVSVSVAELFPGAVSVYPPGAVTVAVFFTQHSAHAARDASAHH